jgi:hypothetical protein
MIATTKPSFKDLRASGEIQFVSMRSSLAYASGGIASTSGERNAFMEIKVLRNKFAKLRTHRWRPLLDIRER